MNLATLQITQKLLKILPIRQKNRLDHFDLVYFLSFCWLLRRMKYSTRAWHNPTNSKKTPSRARLANFNWFVCKMPAASYLRTMIKTPIAAKTINHRTFAIHQIFFFITWPPNIWHCIYYSMKLCCIRCFGLIFIVEAGGCLSCALIAGSGAGRYMGLERCGPTLN